MGSIDHCLKHGVVSYDTFAKYMGGICMSGRAALLDSYKLDSPSFPPQLSVSPLIYLKYTSETKGRLKRKFNINHISAPGRRFF